jgi:uncharacterized membrane protein
MKTLVSALTTILFLSSCGGYFSDSRSSLRALPGPVFEKTQLSYAFVKQNLFQKRCEGCHSNDRPAAGVVLDSFAAVRTNLDRVVQVALVRKTMPPRSPLSDVETALLTAWFNAGAPEGSTSEPAPLPKPVPKPVPSPVPPEGPVVTEGDFDYIKNVLFVKHDCYQCHAPGKQVAHFPLDDLESLKDPVWKVVVPGKPDESSLVFSVETDGRKRMPPIASGDGLSAVETKIIRDWISRGAKASE